MWINKSILKIRDKFYPVMDVSLRHFGEIPDLLNFSWECIQLTD